MQKWLAAVLVSGLSLPAFAQDYEAPAGDTPPSEAGDMTGEMGTPTDVENPPQEAGGYPIDNVSRLQVLPKAMGEVNATFGIGLDKSAVGDNLGLGIGGAYGIIDNLQAGLQLGIVLKNSPADAGLSHVAIGADYSFLSWIAASFDILIVHFPQGFAAVPGGAAIAASLAALPGGVPSSTKVGFAISAPIKYKVADTFALRALHNIPGRLGSQFGTGLLTFVMSDPDTLKSLAFAVGGEFNVSPAFVLALDLAFILPDFKSDNKALPLVISGAYSWSNMGDIGLAFGFDNLTPPDPGPGAADQRFVSLFTRIRF